jgi:pyruvate,water dikinase
MFTNFMAKADELAASAVKKVLKDKPFMRRLSKKPARYFSPKAEYITPDFIKYTIKYGRKPDFGAAKRIMRRQGQLVEARKARLAETGDGDLLRFIVETRQELKEALYGGEHMGLIYAGVLAGMWLNKHVERWTGEMNVIDALAQSVDDNVTSEMGLDLMDVADVVRRNPGDAEALESATDERFFDGLGEESAAAIRGYLAKYGHRCNGEIDISRPRWAERPTMLVPSILSDVRNLKEGERKERFERGLAAARAKEAEVLARVPKGKARKVKRKIDALRAYTGYREYPKFMMVELYWVIKQAILRMADALRIDRDAIFYLTFDELEEALRSGSVDPGLIARRAAEHRRFERLAPPRLLLSTGEAVAGEYGDAAAPEGALVGLAVSAGVAEGRARVVRDLGGAVFGGDDILVTAFTDPSWTPAFVSIKGLVTEVGGALTHGAVVAREYGLPAVVGVEGATRLIKDGQRVRVNGTDGYVELLG